MNARFPKSEKLTHRNLFGELIKDGESVNAFPIKLIYKETELPEDVNYQIGFAVSKRKFKLAVDRNRMKRLMREAWRLNKEQLSPLQSGKSFALLMIYLSNEKVELKDLMKAMEKVQRKWAEKINA